MGKGVSNSLSPFVRFEKNLVERTSYLVKQNKIFDRREWEFLKNDKKLNKKLFGIFYKYAY